MKTPFRRIVAATVAAAALAATGTACTDSGTANADQLTVGFVVDPSWAQVPVAAGTDLFGKHNVDVKVVNFQSGVEALQAAAAGQVDITTAADVPTSAALTRTPTLRVIADGSRWEGSRIVARRSAGINTVADLAGKSIGTPLGTSAAYYVSNALAQNNLKAELVQVAPSAIVTAATQRNVDAVSIFQPYQAQTIKALGDDAVALSGTCVIEGSEEGGDRFALGCDGGFGRDEQAVLVVGSAAQCHRVVAECLDGLRLVGLEDRHR
ncbi:ABC transporter substrate-binding protein, partial [Mycolicibacterium peregrinum]|uniref:ABC transporter substrate-binding protein n=1 Tax=Mycolicibacterium peregrinum TaxID=43304 RepID=UPI000ABB3F70